ncbi:MAG: ubiquinol-cytochrome c reductase iron-sulfur subunit [Betaproteobacteria bacterium]
MINKQRRTVLATGASAAVCAAAMLWRPGCVMASYPRGSPLGIEISRVPQGKLLTLEWQGLPVWLLRRTAAEIEALAALEAALTDPDSKDSVQPSGCRNRHRSLHPEIFVAIGLCTHQGCTPALSASESFLCPCHASRYDLAGRVFKVGPAPANLVIPAYRYEGRNRLVLGEEA